MKKVINSSNRGNEPAKSDNLIVWNWNTNLSMGGIEYELVVSSKCGDSWLACYDSKDAMFEGFETKFSVFYYPPDPTDLTAGGFISAEKLAEVFTKRSKNDGFTLHNSFSYTDPEHSERKVYVLVTQYLNQRDNQGKIFLTFIKQDDNGTGAFMILYRTIIDSDKNVPLQQQTSEWLTAHNDYLNRLGKIDTSNFLVSTFPV